LPIVADISDEEKQWSIFTKAVDDMRSLKLLHFFMEHVVTVVIHDKVLLIVIVHKNFFHIRIILSLVHVQSLK